MTSVETTVDTLVQAFQDYKSTNDQRLKELEHQGRSDGLLEEKLQHLDQLIDQKTAQLDQVEVAHNRPVIGQGGLDYESFENGEYKKAFVSYVRRGDDRRLQSLEQKSLATSVDKDGGFLIPQTLVSRLEENLTNASVIRRLANVMQVSSSSVDLLLTKKGATVGWTGETDAREKTDSPEVHKLSIVPQEMYAKVQATQKLLDDAAIHVEEWLAHTVSSKMAEVENEAFLFGDGDKKPRGILSYPGNAQAEWGKFQSVSYKHEGNSLADSLIDMATSLKGEFLPQATWLMSRATLSMIRKLKDKDGRYLWQPGLDGSSGSNLLGYKIELCDLLSPVTEKPGKCPVIFGNFKRAYQIVDRQGIHVLRDPYSAKPYVEFYTTKRVGGDVVNFEALVLLQLSAS